MPEANVPTPSHDAPSVLICIATHCRPRGLERLLKGIDALTFPKCAPQTVTVVVVDNDPAQSAAATCEAHTSGPWPLVYVAEPRRGIPFARNAAVYAGRRLGAEFLAFIDDDEVPEPTWLDELLYVKRVSGAAVVTGPVLPAFEEAVPAWIERGGFFDRERHRTGTSLERAVTGNVLLRTDLLADTPAPFDERKPLSGGTDTHLFSRIANAGHKIAWADEAIVYEWNPASRLTAKWLVRRSFRVSSNWSSTEMDLHPALSVRTARTIKALGRIAQGVVMLPVALIAGRHMFVKSAQHMAAGAGFIAGMTGHELEEYRTTLGS
jgi:succinoglycan biosynthesis protein ExoM